MSKPVSLEFIDFDPRVSELLAASAPSLLKWSITVRVDLWEVEWTFRFVLKKHSGCHSHQAAIERRTAATKY